MLLLIPMEAVQDQLAFHTLSFCILLLTQYKMSCVVCSFKVGLTFTDLMIKIRFFYYYILIFKIFSFLPVMTAVVCCLYVSFQILSILILFYIFLCFGPFLTLWLQVIKEGSADVLICLKFKSGPQYQEKFISTAHFTYNSKCFK